MSIQSTAIVKNRDNVGFIKRNIERWISTVYKFKTERDKFKRFITNKIYKYMFSKRKPIVYHILNCLCSLTLLPQCHCLVIENGFQVSNARFCGGLLVQTGNITLSRYEIHVCGIVFGAKRFSQRDITFGISRSIP